MTFEFDALSFLFGAIISPLIIFIIFTAWIIGNVIASIREEERRNRK